MVNLNVTNMHIKNSSTGEWDEIAIIAGKSAYQSAVDGGYQGTESEFNADLANCDTANALPLAGGTMEGDIDMDSNTITGLPTPTADSDATPKSYADTKYTKPSGGIPASDLASAVLSPYRTAAAQDAIDATEVIVVNIASYSGSQVRVPASGTNAAITADHVLLASTVGTPTKQTGDWTVTTYDGYLTLSGSASAATTVKLVLGKVGTTI